MLRGKQSWSFKSKPVIIASSAVGGPFEGKGPLAKDFDLIYPDIRLGQDSFEKGEQKFLEGSCLKTIEKANIQKEMVNFFVSGDLSNQIIASSFVARTLAIPYLGIYGACSSSMETLAIAANLIESKSADYVLAAACSHNSSAEKQYRYPTEYGSQKPPTAQWTVTGAGSAIIAAKGDGPKITGATIGKVLDLGIKDPYNMGAAMAPAAVDTIITHFRENALEENYYDYIITGDLGAVGHSIAMEMLDKRKFKYNKEKFCDCGLMIYGNEPKVFSGGSGCACSATVVYGHFLNCMKRGEISKILVVATGALMSPLSYQQKETIPSIAHAVSIEI
jgi:stage V sporulation protein AD